MRLPSPLLALVLLLPVVGGCFKHSVRDERLEPGNRVTNAWKPYVVVGVAPLGKEPIVASCPSGIALYENQTSFINGLAALVTFQLFTPITVSYACAAGEGSMEDATEGARGRSTGTPSTTQNETHEEAPDEEPYDIPIL